MPAFAESFTVADPDTAYREYMGTSKASSTTLYNTCKAKEPPCRSEFFIGHACAKVTFKSSDGCRKDGGKDCTAVAEYGNWQVDPRFAPSVTGKRFWISGYSVKRGVYSKNSDSDNKDCVSLWHDRYKLNTVGSRQFCPKGSEYIAGDTTYSADQCLANFNYTAAYDQCASNPIAYEAYLTSGSCAGGYFDPMDPDPLRQCGCYQQDVYEQYFSCMNTLSQQIASANYNGGECFCSAKTGALRTDHFVFNSATGNLDCLPCREGLKQDFQDGDPVSSTKGTGCVPICNTAAGQAWDPLTKTCRTCSAPNRADPGSGRCEAPCANGLDRDPTTGQCPTTSPCPSGMFPMKDPVTGLTIRDPVTKAYQCGCQDPRFPLASRVPATTSENITIGPLTLLGWKITPLVSSADTTNAGCVCASGGKVSLFDQEDFVSGASAPGSSAASMTGKAPFGIVALQTGVSQFACGCPNYNEKFETVGGVTRCVPKIKGVGAILKPVPTNLDLSTAAARTQVGIFDALSDAPSAKVAKLRNSIDPVGGEYRRQAWSCPEGNLLEANGNCRPIVRADMPILACEDDGGTVVDSSTMISNYAAIQAATGGGTLNRMTNRRTACCLSDIKTVNGISKPHCAASSPVGYANFNDYYNTVTASKEDWGVAGFPNRMYLLNGNGQRVIGVYRDDGSECNVFTAAAKPSEQLQALSDIVARASTPDGMANPFSGVANVRPIADGSIDALRCRFTVRAALEVTCPPNSTDDYGNPVTRTVMVPRSDPTYKSSATVQRCAQADSVRVHVDVVDMSDPKATHRGVIRTLSSVPDGGGGPTMTGASSINIKDIIRPR